MISGIQIIGIMFTLGMIYLSYMYYRRRELSLPDFSVWFIIWIGLFFVIIFPNSLEFLLQPLTVYRVFDLITATGMIILFTLGFFMYTKTRKSQKNIENIVRTLAISDKKPKK